MAVLIQEAHLPVGRLAKARDLVHRLLPAYCLFAGQRRKRIGPVAQIQVVTLVHVYMAARASLLDIGTQFETVAQDAPGALEQVHFIKMSEPRSDTTLLLGNLYQYQASQPAKQKAMLELVGRVVDRWSTGTDLVVVGGDFNASCRPRVGYVDAEVTRTADVRLHEWYQQVGLTCMAPPHATWQSINESRCAVLDCFFWQSRTGKATLQNAEGFLSPDPRLDHDPVRVCVACDTIGPMPPLEALRVPERLKMREWREKRNAWQEAVTQSLSMSAREAPDGDRFAELEKIKRVALDCHAQFSEPQGDGYYASFRTTRRRQDGSRRAYPSYGWCGGRFMPARNRTDNLVRPRGRCEGCGTQDFTHSRRSFGLSLRCGTHRTRFGLRTGSACYGASLP